MLTFSRIKDTVDVKLYEERIRKNGYILCDADSMSLQYRYDIALRDSKYVYTTDIMKHRSNYRYDNCSRDSLYNYLTGIEGCPEHYFRKRGVQGFSLDRKKVLEPLYNNGYAKNFLEMYMDYNICSSRCNNVRSVIEGTVPTEHVNKAGAKLGEISYSVNQQTNLRYNYRGFDIISQIPKDYTKYISVEDGYFLAWGDFAQSDLRIAYNLLLRNSENYKVMYKVDDAYEGIARLVAAANNQDFDLDKFRKERNLYKVYVLETLYGTRNARTIEENDFVQNLTVFLESCDKYKSYIDRIKKRVELNLPVILTGYFGYEQAVPSYRNTEKDILYFALNSPNQTGTSEVVILTINAILDKFYSLGYTEDDISIYMVRHDEPVFKCSERIKKDLWIFSDCSVIQVDDWVPLKLDFTFGYNYQEKDRHLMSVVSQVTLENQDRCNSERPLRCYRSENFFPIPDVITLTYHYSFAGDNTVLAIVSEEKGAFNIYSIKGKDPQVINNVTIKRVYEIASLAPKGQYQGTIVKSNFLNGGFYKNETLIKFVQETNNSLYSAQCISEFYANKYAEKIGVSPEYRDREYEMRQFSNFVQFENIFKKEAND